jgi:hypothetical protein
VRKNGRRRRITDSHSIEERGMRKYSSHKGARMHAWLTILAAAMMAVALGESHDEADAQPQAATHVSGVVAQVALTQE